MQPGLRTIHIPVLIAFPPAYYCIVILSPLGGRNLYIFSISHAQGLAQLQSPRLWLLSSAPAILFLKPHFLITPKHQALDLVLRS